MSLLPTLVPIDGASRVAEVRRLAVACAEAEELGEQACGEIAIIASEIATNLVKHAVSGEVHVSRLSPEGESGVQILSIDRGPGMANLQACTADGFSTAGTAGTGMGAVSRLADVFDVYSQVGRGTILVARKFRRERPQRRDERWVFGAVRVPYPGEQACGDNWTVRHNDGHTFLIVADGLGHGILAADASAAAMNAFKKAPLGSPASLLEDVHLALRPTRGAAVAVLTISDHSGKVKYAGLGNIAGILFGDSRARSMLSHNGTAGHEARRIQEFEYVLGTDSAIVMHSDGLTSSWNVEAYPGLLRRHPAAIAGVLYRDASRGRDDVCVVVGKRMAE